MSSVGQLHAETIGRPGLLVLYIQEQQNKKTRAKTRARKVSKKANMPWALCATKSFAKQGNVWELDAKQSKENRPNAAEALNDDEVNIW